MKNILELPTSKVFLPNVVGKEVLNQEVDGKIIQNPRKLLNEGQNMKSNTKILQSKNVFYIIYSYRDFVDDSDSSSSYSESISSSGSSSSESSREKISKARPKQSVIKKPQIIVQTKSYTITKVPIQTQPVRKDRFFDESRNIPNDVYFGDVKGNSECRKIFSLKY